MCRAGGVSLLDGIDVARLATCMPPPTRRGHFPPVISPQMKSLVAEPLITLGSKLPIGL